MNVLHLTNENNSSAIQIENALKSLGVDYELHCGDINLFEKSLDSYALIIKDRYNVGLGQTVWAQNPNVLGLIPAYLPYNKGVNSNLWSFVKDTPKGGSIFFLRDNSYTIDLVDRFEVAFDEEDTLRTSFDKIFDEIYIKLIKQLPSLIDGTAQLTRMTDADGTVYTRAQSDPFMAYLPQGYDTPVRDISRHWESFTQTQN